MNAASEDIREMLEAQSSLGLVFATNLFIGQEPDEPFDCVTIFDTMGYAPQLTMDVKHYFYPSIQIRVRDTSYSDGWALIHDILLSLHGRANETWNGTLYTLIQCMGDPAFMDWDTRGRCRFISNYNIQRR